MQDLQKTIELIFDYIKGVWIKKRYVMICSWLICPLGFLYVAAKPDVFESQARVYVDTRSVLQPLLRGLAIQTNPQQEIAMMVKTLLNRANLEAIARESDLDITAKNATEYEALISSLSSNIKLRAAGRDNLYTIAYENANPEMAKTIVQATLDLFVEGMHGNNRKDSESATQFLEEQIDEYEARLASAEQKVADFKRKYSDMLPNQGSFTQNYNQLLSELENTKLTIKETEQQMKTLLGEVVGSNNENSQGAVRRTDSKFALTTTYDSRIESLEANLDQLKLKYTDLHPDVIEANNLLKSLKDSREKEIQDYYAARENIDSGAPIGSISSELKIEATRMQGVIASLKVRQADYESKIEAIRQKIDLVPQVEAESVALNRDYGITKRKYEELLSRKESNDLAQKADVSSEDVKFRVIDPPLAPLKPSGPNRIIGYVAVLIVGFSSGLGLAFLISQLNPILLRGSQLTSLTSYPVFGIVSHLHTKEIRKVNRNRMLVFIASSGVILVAFASLVGFELLHINVYARIFS